MNIAIFGLGLIGGSIGRSIIKNTDNVVYGYDVDSESLLKAKMLKAINHTLKEEDYDKMDMVIVATNPKIAIEIINEVSPKLNDGAVVVDCCGNKRIVVDEMKRLAKKYPKIKYYGGHPMAGREFSGIAHSTSNLLDRAFFILVTVNGDILTTASLKAFWISLGCLNVVITDSETHDEIISYTSQLAHVVSSAYIKNPLSQKHVGYSAGSFRDMTRVAKLNPTMWAELMIENRDNLVWQIEDLIKNLQEYKTAIDNGDEEGLKLLLQQGNDLKESAEKSRKNGVNND
ncbi:MAG: prephenate dehydrogenase [Clostridia bacterium]|nr:prephenate dehydrogenase [Clostridia bacterium]MDY5263782.1 prephenate dehydrogenase [Eubacteriales bacterium]MDY5439531.1 prephenate dehydrogenase [Eubacteriales bacterium]